MMIISEESKSLSVELVTEEECTFLAVYRAVANDGCIIASTLRYDRIIFFHLTHLATE